MTPAAKAPAKAPELPRMREEVQEIPEAIVKDLAEIEMEKVRLDQMSKAIVRTFFTTLGNTDGPQWQIDLAHRRARRMVEIKVEEKKKDV